MTEEQIDELLTGIISMYAPKFGRAMTRKAASKLATSRVDGQIEYADERAYALAKIALSKCGTILEENRGDGILAGVILSGAAGLNPAFLVLWMEDGTIHFTASAKEGLINQHTAERAIDAFKSALASAEDS